VFGILKAAALILASFVLTTQPALAHHLMGGRMPTTFVEGLLSGLGHPVIGIDHFAAVVAVGCIAAVYRAGALLIVAYVLAMISGVDWHVRGATVVGDELMVAGSVVVLGALLLSRWRLPLMVALILFALTGLIHGYALGESMYGVEPSPLIAYFIGLAVIQIVVANVVMLAARMAMQARASESLPIYIVGIAVVGVGLVFMAQQILA
jgi:urease accessory protein